MSVLQRKELEDSPLADLHAIASELGVEGYRALRRDDLVSAILEAQGVMPDADDEPADGEPVAAPDESARAGSGDALAEEAVEGRGGRGRARRSASSAKSEEAHVEVTGVLEIRPNGSGFLVVDGDDGTFQVYVSPAQIRRCELRAGDEVTGAMRPPRRNERHHSLVHVERVNGRDPESAEARPDFSKLTAVYPTESFSGVAAFGSVSIGKGSRVALAGSAGAGASTLLRQMATQLAALSDELELTVLLADVRPEEIAEWRAEGALSVAGGSFDTPTEEIGQAAELALERSKRVVERGGDAVVLVDSLEGLAPVAARRVFGAGRKLEEGGSLTVIAAMRPDSGHLRLATTSVTLDGSAPGEPITPERAQTQRADLLG